MKERQKNISWQNDTEKLKRCDQVAVTRLRTVYSRTLTLEHIIWQCKETEEERRKSNITKKIWEKGEEGSKMLVEYVKNIGLYHGL
jgi:hypothetical protein